MKIAVGSKNPVKINAVREAFEKVWPEKNWEVVGVEVSSGVSNQPMSDVEGIKGAKTRAKKVMKLVDADFGVGLEGALQKIGNKWFEGGWMVVLDRKGNEGVGSSIKLNIPQKMMKMVKEGKEKTANNKKDILEY
jgi:inosine/xanthosine triphosphatase